MPFTVTAWSEWGRVMTPQSRIGGARKARSLGWEIQRLKRNTLSIDASLGECYGSRLKFLEWTIEPLTPATDSEKQSCQRQSKQQSHASTKHAVCRLSVGGGGFPEKYRDGVGLPVPSEVDGKEQKYRYHTWTDQEFWTSRLEARLREVIWCQCIVISGTYFSFSDKPITEYQWFMVTELLPQPLWSLYLFGNISQGKPTEKKTEFHPV